MRVKLEEIADVKAGGTPSRSKKEYWNGNIKWLKISDIKSKYISKTTETITPLGVEKSSTKIFEKGTILYTIFATLGEVAILTEKMATNQAIAGIKIFDENKVYSDYLYFYLISIKKDIMNMGRGVAQNNINLSILRNIEIPLPTLSKQKSIAKTLDKAKELIELRKASIEKLDELSKAVFVDMFGDPVENEMGWEIITCIKEAKCIVPGRDKPKSFTGMTKWVTTNDLQDKRILKTKDIILGLTDSEIENVRAKIIPKESVIFTCVGNLGIVSIIDDDIIMNQQLHSFQCNEKLNNIFLMFNISYQKPYMYKYASQTTVPYMNKTVCNNIPLILPPLDLQNKFAKTIQKIEAQKALYEEELKKLEYQFEALLSGSFEE